MGADPALDMTALTALGEQARAEHDGPLGNCYEVSQSLKTLLVDETDLEEDDITIKEVRLGDAGTVRHNVVELPGDVLDGAPAHRVLVDATLDQFCTENAADPETDIEVALGPRDQFDPVTVFYSPVASPYR